MSEKKHHQKYIPNVAAATIMQLNSAALDAKYKMLPFYMTRLFVYVSTVRLPDISMFTKQVAITVLNL